MSRQGDNVVHVEFISGPMAGQHRYFGSMKAIYREFTKQDIGIGYDKLTRKKPSALNPYQNGKVIVRKSELVRSKERTKSTPRIIRVN